VPKAFVLINTEIGAEEEVLKQIRNLEEVKEAYIVYGIYDLFVEVEAENLEKLKDIISSKIRRLAKVKSTITMIVVSSTSSPI